MSKAKLDMALARALYSRKKLMKIKKRVMMFMRYLMYYYLQKVKKFLENAA
jgi:16S rRNA G527 N7-methylase RsmG